MFIKRKKSSKKIENLYLMNIIVTGNNAIETMTSHISLIANKLNYIHALVVVCISLTNPNT